MKPLQNDFTTPEQSKRLLELGVPKDSADCYYTSQTSISHGENGTIFYHPKWFEYNDTYSKLKSQFPLTDYLIPCWSVGRLIEIYYICAGRMPNIEDEDFLYYLIEDYELGTLSKQLDFSKLEE